MDYTLQWQTSNKEHEIANKGGTTKSPYGPTYLPS